MNDELIELLEAVTAELFRREVAFSEAQPDSLNPYEAVVNMVSEVIDRLERERL